MNVIVFQGMCKKEISFVSYETLIIFVEIYVLPMSWLDIVQRNYQLIISKNSIQLHTDNCICLYASIFNINQLSHVFYLLNGDMHAEKYINSVNECDSGMW